MFDKKILIRELNKALDAISRIAEIPGIHSYLTNEERNRLKVAYNDLLKVLNKCLEYHSYHF